MSEADDDKVGYRKPPKHSQFTKGVSGNPRGRPKKAPKATGESEINRVLDGVCGTIEVNGKVREITGREAILRGMLKGALKSSTNMAKLWKLQRDLIQRAVNVRKNRGESTTIQFTLPAPWPLDDWEQIAIPMQRKLMEEVRK